MRKLISIVLAAVFGITVGLGSSNVWFGVHPLPYCTVARNPEWYHGKFIRVKARLILSGGEMSVYEKCDPVEALIARVQSTEEIFKAESDSIWGALVYTGVKADLKTADAIIEGEFNGYYSKGCWGPKYYIAARKIELISEVRDYVPPSTEGLPTRSND